MSRHDRRRFRHQVSGADLLTSLVHPDDPKLHEVPIMARAVRWWISSLPSALPPRECLLCHRLLWCEADIGAILLSLPITPTASVGCAGLCFACYRDESWGRIEVACTIALQAAVPGGNFVDAVLQYQ